VGEVGVGVDTQEACACACACVLGAYTTLHAQWSGLLELRAGGQKRGLRVCVRTRVQMGQAGRLARSVCNGGAHPPATADDWRARQRRRGVAGESRRRKHRTGREGFARACTRKCHSRHHASGQERERRERRGRGRGGDTGSARATRRVGGNKVAHACKLG